MFDAFSDSTGCRSSVFSKTEPKSKLQVNLPPVPQGQINVVINIITVKVKCWNTSFIHRCHVKISKKSYGYYLLVI